ncbi:conserved hypothetical protein [Ricinus communis]|uniref:Uncharacterized protein n=1 Tax=Ricinus communis TaxID=3988 RepID=B9S5H8_RICCO|nr:conserved hypothetical protein [Ricinus communis]
MDGSFLQVVENGAFGFNHYFVFRQIPMSSLSQPADDELEWEEEVRDSSIMALASSSLKFHDEFLFPEDASPYH